MYEIRDVYKDLHSNLYTEHTNIWESHTSHRGGQKANYGIKYSYDL